MQTQTWGGKKLRPYLTMIGYGKYSHDVVPVAAAQELLHSAVLMHDDVIDEDTIRRGRQNINGIYQAKYGPFTSQKLSRHYSYGAGVLAGDALLSEAYRVLFDAPFSPAVISSVAKQLHQSVFHVIGGELMDVEAGFMKDAHYDPMTIYRHKTASYSFIGPLLAGALCRSAHQRELRLLEKIGNSIGIAFQLQDDLLGVFGNKDTLGKTVLLDLKEGKATHLIACHKARMSTEQKTHFLSTFGNQRATKSMLEQLKSDLVVSGAQRECEELAANYFHTATGHINALPNGLQRNELTAIIRELTHRQS